MLTIVSKKEKNINIDNNMSHMIGYVLNNFLLYENIYARFPKVCAVRTRLLSYDIYTHGSERGLCFPTLMCSDLNRLSHDQGYYLCCT